MSEQTSNEDLAAEVARLRGELERVTKAPISRDALKTMTPADIEKARREGRLSDALKGN